jgi:RNA polymerase subunit RPABC4/transcription elongation factor Spt4
LRTDVKRITARAAEKEIQCAFCAEKLRITEDMQYCRYCGQIIPQCRVCGSPIVYGDEILQCPHCKAYAHKTHLIEWIKVKGYCPVCGVDVEESKDFPAELLEETKTIISEDEEEDEIISFADEEQRCASCGRLIAEAVRYCPYCGKQIAEFDSST